MQLAGKTIGQIRIDELVGEGGMGAVYRGFDLRLERTVAVKTLHDRYRDDPVGRARFLREAQILSRLDHPGICKVYGLLRHEDSDLLVLEWLEGRTLDQAAADARPERKLELAIAVADALAAAHGQQIVHRDLKPDNVVVNTEGQLKILDFGIARSADGLEALAADADDDDSFFFADRDLDSTWSGGVARTPRSGRRQEPAEAALTRVGNTVGTVAYMSPEQVGGLPLSVASDMYSVGILLQEMFTGRRAYDDVGLVQLMSRVVVGQTRPLGDMDPDLADLIRSLQSLDEASRPSAAATRDELRRILHGPEERRRKAIRRTVAGLVAAILLLALAAIVQQRLEAQRSVSRAREMTRIAAEAEWLMRAEHLAPPHDLRPARREVRRRMEELQQRRQALDVAGRAVGDLALGRAALALGDIDEAVGHLEHAWAGGVRDAGAAASYGLALAETVRRQLVKADRQNSEEERLHLRAEAEAIRLRAQELLRAAMDPTSAESETEPGTAQLASAQLAFLDGRWETAESEASAASEAEAWFYEGHLLAARSVRQQVLRSVHADGNLGAAAADQQRALEHLDRAATVGRSDPEVYLERCALAYDLLVLALQWEFEPALPHDEGLEACRAAVALDPDNARGHLFAALLHARAAEIVDDETSRDGQLESSLEAARRAVELDPRNAEAWRALAMGSMVRADDLAVRGGDAEGAIANTIEACRKGLEVAPRDLDLLNLLGNAEGASAETAWARGYSVVPAVERAAAAYRRAIAVDESLPHSIANHPRVNLALQLEVAVRSMAAAGDDPRSMAEEGLVYARGVLDRNDKDGYAWTAEALLSAHVGRWFLDRDDAGSAEPWIERALEAATQADRWRKDTYAQQAVVQARHQALRLAAAQGDEGAIQLHLGQALERSARLVEEDPEFVEGWIHRADLLAAASGLAQDPSRRRQLADAGLEAARRAVAIDPRHVPARRALQRAERGVDSRP